MSQNQQQIHTIPGMESTCAPRSGRPVLVAPAAAAAAAATDMGLAVGYNAIIKAFLFITNSNH